MVEEQNKDSGTPHKCGLLCLGPLTFHREVRGEKIHLSQGNRLAERKDRTFRNGLVFSNRPVKVQERIRIRVEKGVFMWHGALRVGFTNVSPSDRSLPLPSLAIPDLTTIPGHWAVPVNESHCQAGSELEFWVSSSGHIHIKSNYLMETLPGGVDLTQPLWVMIDIYGQTRSIFLLGSEKKGLVCNRTSCPVPKCLKTPNVDNRSMKNDCHMFPFDSFDKCCVVCLGNEARTILPCGHQCVCNHCIDRVVEELGTCPLCRQRIFSLPEKDRCESGIS